MSAANESAVGAAEETAARIKREAAALFVERGYSATTMKAIAQRVGMTPGALYWHFPSKESILLAYLVERTEELMDVVGKAIATGSPSDRLAALVRTQVLLNLNHITDGGFDVLYGVVHLARHLPPEEQVELARRQRAYLKTVRGILADGIAAGEFRPVELAPTAFAILTLCDFVVVWYRTTGPLSPEDVADMYADFALRMVARDGQPCR